MYANNIVNEKISFIRKLGAAALSGKKLRAIGFCLFLFMLSDMPAIIVGSLSSSYAAQILLQVYSVLVAGPLNLALMFYFLRLFRGQDTEGSLAFGFNNVWNAFALYIRMFLGIFLWSLCFVIPGIVAMYRYSQAFFILADDPTKSPAQCIAESSYIMNGNKKKLLLLDLSWLLWYIAASIPAEVANFFLMGADFVVYMPESIKAAGGIVYHPLASLLFALQVIVSVYYYSSKSCFYDLASGNLTLYDSIDDFSDPDPEDIPFSDGDAEALPQEDMSDGSYQ